MIAKRLFLGAAVCALSPLHAFAEPVTQPVNMNVPQAAQPQVVAVNEEGKAKIVPDDKGIFTLVWENDIFANTDSNYTNGFRLGWLSAESSQYEAANWVAKNLLPGSDYVQANNRVSLSLGQSMFTPDNIRQSGLIKNDRPYAGYTYVSAGIVSDTGKTLDNAQLTLGIVGPASGAKATQKFVHKIINANDPSGWDNQIKNEPGVELAYERKWRNLYQYSPNGLGVDATPHVGVNLGNIHTYASTGATFRLGYDLPADYGPPRIRPSLPGSDFFVPTKELGGYIFTSLEGRAVARNIFLDGNTFTDSHSVDKENFIGNIQTGVAVTYGDTRVSYTHVFNTKEFEGQKEPAQFGVVTVSTRF